MAPEYGATCGFFRIDDKTLDYLRLTGRDEEQIALVEAYAKAQGFWLDADARRPDLHRHARARHGHRRARRSPGPSARRTRSSLTEVDDVFNADLLKVYDKERPDARARSRARTTTSATATW